MTKVKLIRARRQGYLIGFEAAGHSGYGEYGDDIVCAAVSVLTTVTVRGLQQRLQLQPRVEIDEDDGVLTCMLDPKSMDEATFLRAQDLLETMAMGLKEIAKDYPAHVLVEEVAR